MLKFTPPEYTVAPSGKLFPILSFGFARSPVMLILLGA
jgi:hypothetical protein